MTRRAAILLSLTAFVAGSMGLGFYVATPPLERVREPRSLDPVVPIVTTTDRATRRIIFTMPTDAAWVGVLPPGLEDEEPGSAILSSDRQSIFALFRRESEPSFAQEALGVLLNHHWPKVQWTLWRFPLLPTPTAPTTLPTCLATLNSDFRPQLLLSSQQVLVSNTIAAGPEWEEKEYYRLRL